MDGGSHGTSFLLMKGAIGGEREGGPAKGRHLVNCVLDRRRVQQHSIDYRFNK